VVGGVEMLGGVLIFRGVAAADVAAGEAEAKVDPGIAHFETFFTALRFGFYFFDLVEMRTNVRHDFSPAASTSRVE
jgi:hypothetical protein